jgi:hypothetical protein
MPSSIISWVNVSAMSAPGCAHDASRATVVSKPERPVLAPELAGTVAYAGVGPMLEGRALQDALRAAIAHRRGYCWWTVDHAGWVVTLHSPERQEFSGRTLEEALAWCLVSLMAVGWW